MKSFNLNSALTNQKFFPLRLGSPLGSKEGVHLTVPREVLDKTNDIRLVEKAVEQNVEGLIRNGGHLDRRLTSERARVRHRPKTHKI